MRKYALPLALTAARTSCLSSKSFPFKRLRRGILHAYYCKIEIFPECRLKLVWATACVRFDPATAQHSGKCLPSGRRLATICAANQTVRSYPFSGFAASRSVSHFCAADTISSFPLATSRKIAPSCSTRNATGVVVSSKAGVFTQDLSGWKWRCGNGVPGRFTGNRGAGQSDKAGNAIVVYCTGWELWNPRVGGHCRTA